jgi:hypothetical protein
MKTKNNGANPLAATSPIKCTHRMRLIDATIASGLQHRVAACTDNRLCSMALGSRSSSPLALVQLGFAVVLAVIPS